MKERNTSNDRAVDGTPSQICLHAVSRLKWVKPINVNESIGLPDDVSKTMLGEEKNAAPDLGLHCWLRHAYLTT